MYEHFALGGSDRAAIGGPLLQTAFLSLQENVFIHMAVSFDLHLFLVPTNAPEVSPACPVPLLEISGTSSAPL